MWNILKLIFRGKPSGPRFVLSNSAGYGYYGNKPAYDLLRYAQWLQSSTMNNKSLDWFWWWKRELDDVVLDMYKHNGVVFNKSEAYELIRRINCVEETT